MYGHPVEQPGVVAAGGDLPGVRRVIQWVVYGLDLPLLPALLRGYLPGRVPSPLWRPFSSPGRENLYRIVQAWCYYFISRVVGAAGGGRLFIGDGFLVVGGWAAGAVRPGRFLDFAGRFQAALRGMCE
jgi:hypothetical protein